MRTIVTWLLPLVLLGAALWSLADAHYHLLRLAAGEESPRNLISRAAAPSVPPEDLPALARRLSSASEQAVDPDEKHALACRAESAIVRASRARPASAPIALEMGRLSQVGIEGCADEPLPEYSLLARFASKSEPAGIEAHYLAGKLHDRAGDRSAALSSFRRALELSRDLPIGWIDDMFSVVRGAEDLPALIPPDLRTVNDWDTLIFERDPELYREAAEELGSMRAEALSAIPPPGPAGLDAGTLRSLETFAQLATGASRAEADVRLAAALPGDHKGRFFESRRKLADLRVVPSSIASDGRPTSSSFVSWGGASPVRLDYADSSVGFYLAPGQSARRIEIRGHPLDPLPAVDRLVVYAGEDNLAWKELRDGLAVEVARIDGRPVLTVKSVPRSFRYWKLHFPGSSEPKSFGNRGDAVLRVFGDGAN